MAQSTPPEQVKQPRFFYGWVIVFITAIKGSFMIGTAQFASSVFLVPMQEELGWSRTQLFGALTVRGLVAGAMQPFVGQLGDRITAPRVVVPIGVVLLGVSTMSLRWVDNIVLYYIWYGVVGAIGMSLISNAIMDAIVFKWFIRKRPQVVMWTNMGPGSAPLLFPVMLTGLIALVGWRDAWLWFGAGTIIILLPMSLLIRTRPEQMGLHPDGVTDPAQQTTSRWQSSTALGERSYTRSEAVRSRTFWVLTFAMAFGIFGVPGFQAHWIPYFRENGYQPGLAATVLLVFGAAGLTSRVLWAYVTTRFQIRVAFASQAALAAVATAAILLTSNVAVLFIWAVVAGMTLVSFFQLQALIAVTYFGREHIGAIRGLMWPLSTVSAASAPSILGAVRDWRGDYTLAFLIVAASWTLCAALLLMARPLQSAEQVAPQPQS